MISIIKGDSYAHDFTSEDVPTFDSDWTGKWAIVPKLGSAVVVSGNLGKSVDNTTMQLRISPAISDTIPAGSYVLVVQISNNTLSFRQEVLQDTFIVKPQGILG